MARPRVIGSMITGWLAERQRATAREVAHSLRMPVPMATKHLHRLAASGEVSVVERVRVEHADRPVAVYAPAQRPQLALISDDWLRRD